MNSKGYSHGEPKGSKHSIPNSILPPYHPPSPAVLRCWANIDFLSLRWPVELRAKRWLLSSSSGRQSRLSAWQPRAAAIPDGSRSRAALMIRRLSFGLQFVSISKPT